MLLGGLGIDFVEEFLEKFPPIRTNTPSGAYPVHIAGTAPRTYRCATVRAILTELALNPNSGIIRTNDRVWQAALPKCAAVRAILTELALEH